MFIIWNIPEQKYFADIKHVTFRHTADSLDLSDSVAEFSLFNAEIIHSTNGYYH